MKLAIKWPMAAATAVVVALTSLAAAAEPRKFSGEYSLYSGTLDDRGLPNRKDAKVWMEISGRAAARMYGYMGAAAKVDYCTNEEEARSRDELMCFRNKKTGDARCRFGFDMRTGKSIGGVIC